MLLLLLVLLLLLLVVVVLLMMQPLLVLLLLAMIQLVKNANDVAAAVAVENVLAQNMWLLALKSNQ